MAAADARSPREEAGDPNKNAVADADGADRSSTREGRCSRFSGTGSAPAARGGCSFEASSLRSRLSTDLDPDEAPPPRCNETAAVPVPLLRSPNTEPTLPTEAICCAEDAAGPSRDSRSRMVGESPPPLPFPLPLLVPWLPLPGEAAAAPADPLATEAPAADMVVTIEPWRAIVPAAADPNKPLRLALRRGAFIPRVAPPVELLSLEDFLC